ncbi:hypothetical protein D3C86_1231180 [compost metagenome]
MLEVSVGERWLGVLPGEDLALLGDLEVAPHAARGLGEDGAVARPAAAADGAAAAVEEAQAHPFGRGKLGEGLLCLVQLPGGAQDPAVLVAVRVAEHDLLHVAARAQGGAVGGVGEQGAKDVGGGPQVRDGLEEGHQVQGGFGGAVGAAPVEAHVLHEGEDFQKVARGFGHADDVGVEGVGAELGDGAREHSHGLSGLGRARFEVGLGGQQGARA